MKYLMIDRSQGFYKTDKEEPKMPPIDQITKEDLLKLLDLCVGEDFEMDVFDAKNLKNAAHQIIYKNIYLKLDGVRKQPFVSLMKKQYCIQRQLRSIPLNWNLWILSKHT